MSGNTRLVQYGIFDESPDTIRIHVGYATGLIFVFKSGDAQTQLKRITYRERDTYTEGIVTARGVAIPYDEIPNLRFYEIPRDLLSQSKVMMYSPTSDKGELAVTIASKMIERGLIGLPITIKSVDNIKLQIKGVDGTGEVITQIKMDWKAGPKERGGTGNLYLQTWECNPNSYH